MKLVIHVDNGFKDYFLLKKELDKIVPGLSSMKDYNLVIDNTPEHKRLNTLRRKKSKKSNKKALNNKKGNELEIVIGCNASSEYMSKRYAKEKRIKTVEYPVKWDDFSKPCVVKEGKYGKYNALAAIKRDEAMYDDIRKTNGLIVFMTNGSDPYIYKAVNKANEEGLMVATIKY